MTDPVCTCGNLLSGHRKPTLFDDSTPCLHKEWWLDQCPCQRFEPAEKTPKDEGREDQ